MKSIPVEVFICDDSCCVDTEAVVENALKKFENLVEIKVYDTDFPPEVVKKYGVLKPPTVIVNQKIKITKIYPHLLKKAVAKELNVP